jgi:carboxypeptidase C (cathepsin A)
MKKACVLLLFVCAPVLLAQQPETEDTSRRASIASPATSALERRTPPPASVTSTTTTERRESKETAKDQISTTHHTITIGGQPVGYTASAGTMVMKDEEGNAIASFFFVSYTKDGADPARRPVTYTFNGGPGSSSVWLHMGAFGPKRVAYADDAGHAASPPRRQRRLHPRRHRSGLHRPRHHRLQPGHSIQGRQPLPRRRRRCAVRR